MPVLARPSWELNPCRRCPGAARQPDTFGWPVEDVFAVPAYPPLIGAARILFRWRPGWPSPATGARSIISAGISRRTL